MVYLLPVVWGILELLRRLIPWHLAVVNEGSPTPETAFEIADITLAQAFYGRLAAQTPAYYRFTLDEPASLRLSLLIPERYYVQHFRPDITLSGAALDEGALELPSGDYGTRSGTTSYQRTQQATPHLAPGNYLVALHSNTEGVYCFCVGTREPQEYADATTRARVQALLFDEA